MRLHVRVGVESTLEQVWVRVCTWCDCACNCMFACVEYQRKLVPATHTHTQHCTGCKDVLIDHCMQSHQQCRPTCPHNTCTLLHLPFFHSTLAFFPPGAESSPSFLSAPSLVFSPHATSFNEISNLKLAIALRKD